MMRASWSMQLRAMLKSRLPAPNTSKEHNLLHSLFTFFSEQQAAIESTTCGLLTLFIYV